MSLLPEIASHICQYVGYKCRLSLAQVSVVWRDACYLERRTSLCEAVVKSDLFSIVHLSKRRHFMSNKYVCAYILELLVEYPCADILEFLCLYCRISIPNVVAVRIFMNKAESAGNTELANRCLEISLIANKAGAKNIICLHNNTLDIIPDMSQTIDPLISCANNCINTLTFMMHNRAADLYDKYSDIVFLATYYRYGHLLRRLLDFAMLVYTPAQIREFLVKRAYLMAITRDDTEMQKILSKYAIYDNIEELFSHINLYDSRYYGTKHFGFKLHQQMLLCIYLGRSVEGLDLLGTDDDCEVPGCDPKIFIKTMLTQACYLGRWQVASMLFQYIAIVGLVDIFGPDDLSLLMEYALMNYNCNMLQAIIDVFDIIRRDSKLLAQHKAAWKLFRREKI